MTKKRFEINNLVKKGNMSFWDNKNKSILNASHTLDLLNNLSEDYDYLEKRFKEEEWHYEHIDEDRDVWMYKCHKLEKENEQLKMQLQNTSAQRDEFHRGARENANRVGKLKKENEQLKSKVKELEIENQGQSDAIDGLQGFMAHYDLEDILND